MKTRVLRAVVVSAVMALSLISCFDSSKDNKSMPALLVLGSNSVTDTTAPTVSSTAPADKATGVAINQAIAITFSEAIKSDSVAGNFTISGGVTAAASVSGAVLTLTPNAALAASTAYTVTLSNITDLAGNPMGAPYSFGFTTGTVDTTAPTVVYRYPKPNSINQSTNPPFTIGFTENILSSSVNSTNISISPSVTGTFNVNGNMVTFTPSAPLP